MPKDKTEADLQKAAEEKAAQWYDFCFVTGLIFRKFLCLKVA